MMKLADVLNEISYKNLDRNTPTKYKERARDISIRLMGKTPRGKYIYRTVTRENGNVHHQWARTLGGKPFDGLEKDVVVWCDCGNFTYENEWLLWKNDASHIVNSNGEPLRVRNPLHIVKLCKHLVAIMPDLKKQVGKNIIPVAPKVAPKKTKTVEPTPVKKPTVAKKPAPKPKVTPPPKVVPPKKEPITGATKGVTANQWNESILLKNLKGLRD